MSRRLPILIVSFVLLTSLQGCVKGPKYVKPQVQIPASYKEIIPDNFKETDDWKFARPADDVIRGKWWELFNDSQLSALEERVNISNQSIALAEANFRSARALVKQSRSQYFPTVTTSPSIVTSRSWWIVHTQPMTGSFCGTFADTNEGSLCRDVYKF